MTNTVTSNPVVKIESLTSKDYSVSVYRVSQDGVSLCVSKLERVSILEAADFTQKAIAYFQFEVRALPEGEFYEVRIVTRFGTSEVYLIQR